VYPVATADLGHRTPSQCRYAPDSRGDASASAVVMTPDAGEGRPGGCGAGGSSSGIEGSIGLCSPPACDDVLRAIEAITMPSSSAQPLLDSGGAAVTGRARSRSRSERFALHPLLPTSPMPCYEFHPHAAAARDGAAVTQLQDDMSYGHGYDRGAHASSSSSSGSSGGGGGVRYNKENADSDYARLQSGSQRLSRVAVNALARWLIANQGG
jgi:hypothetical protein